MLLLSILFPSVSYRVMKSGMSLVNEFMLCRNMFSDGSNVKTGAFDSEFLKLVKSAWVSTCS